MGDEWVGESEFRWRARQPFGVEVRGDLSRRLPGVAADRLVELFKAHGLILARDQALDRAQHNELMRLFGQVQEHREGDTGYIRSEGEEGQATTELAFHADTAYTDTPFEGLSLHAIDVVPGASSTRFVNVEHAWRSLPEPLRTLLEQHDADMMSVGNGDLAARRCDTPRGDDPAYRNQLPSIRLNPKTGRRYVAVSEMHTAALVGMPWEDSRAALGEVFRHLYAPETLYEHFWRNGDLIIWDNVACQHARGSLRHVGRRVLQRVILGSKSHPTPQKLAQEAGWNLA